MTYLQGLYLEGLSSKEILQNILNRIINLGLTVKRKKQGHLRASLHT